MKGMKDAQEFYQAPPPGRYTSQIIAAESTVAKKSGASMIHLTLEVTSPANFKGAQSDDYIITDGGAPGGGMGKTKLRGLGINVETNDEIPDAAICQHLLGRTVDVDYGNEPKMTRSVADGPYDKEMTAVDSRTGMTIVLQKLTVKGYAPAGQVAAVAQAPAQQYVQQAPVQQGPVQQFMPQGQLVQQFAPGQVNPAGFAQPQYAPQQLAQPQFAPQAQPQLTQAPVQAQAPGVASPPWIAGNNGAAAPVQAAATEEGKKRRKPQIQDVPPGQ